MDTVLLTQSFSGWDPQCYRITNAKFIQFKREFTSFANITSFDKSQIEREYELSHLNCAVTLENDNEPLLQIEINHFQLFLKFFGDQRMQEFAAWLRILASCKPPTPNPKCMERPIASNLCFSLYHTLQMLYHQHAKAIHFVLPTKAYRQQHLSSIQHISHQLAVHYNINVLQSADMDFNLLFNVLLYMLANLPTSLFTFKYQQKLSQLVGDIVADKSDNQKDDSKHSDEHIAKLDDRDALGSLKNAFIRYYTTDKKIYKQKNGFALFHRYGFLALLFTFLNFVYNAHQHLISLDAFATLMANALRSARADTQSVDMGSFYAAEQHFRVLVKVCIYYAREIFASPRKVPWKVYTLLTDSGNERKLVDQYNELVKQRNEYRRYIFDAQKLEKSLEIKTRKWRFKSYKNCFVGKDAIYTILNLKLAQHSMQAVAFGDKLRQYGIIQHVDQKHKFKNEKLFYRFVPGYRQRVDLERTPHTIGHLKIHRHEQFDASLDDRESRRQRTLEVEDSKLHEIEFSAMSDSGRRLSTSMGARSSDAGVFVPLVKPNVTDMDADVSLEEVKEQNSDDVEQHVPIVKTADHPGTHVARPITPHYAQSSSRDREKNADITHISLYDDEHQPQDVKLIKAPDDEVEEEEEKEEDNSLDVERFVVDLDIIQGTQLCASDPQSVTYVLVKLLDQSQESKRRPHGTGSQVGWHQGMRFVTQTEPATLTFDVWNVSAADDATERLIGWYQVPMASLFLAGHPGYNTVMTLQKVDSGSLSVQLKCKRVAPGALLRQRTEFEILHDTEQSQVTSGPAFDGREKLKTHEIVLNILIESGINLHNPLLPVQCNPFVVVHAASYRQFRTDTVRDNGSPRFDAKAQFRLPRNPHRLLFKIYNDRSALQTAELIGTAEYNIDALLYAGNIDTQTVELAVDCGDETKLQNAKICVSISAGYVLKDMDKDPHGKK